MGVYGTYKGAKELLYLKRIPQSVRLLCVQQETCAPMVHAFEAGSEVIRSQDIVQNPHWNCSGNSSGGSFQGVSLRSADRSRDWRHFRGCQRAANPGSTQNGGRI